LARHAVNRVFGFGLRGDWLEDGKRGQLRARRKTDDADAVRIETELGGARAQIAKSALRILRRVVSSVEREDAVTKNKTRYAARFQSLSDQDAFMIDGAVRESAARAYQHARAGVLTGGWQIRNDGRLVFVRSAGRGRRAFWPELDGARRLIIDG
jgi:hypothetical protein